MTARVRFGNVRSRVLRLIAEHNPFYLISAACMLAGCLALTNSLSWSPIALRRLLMLIATLNVYEAALLGLGVVLIAKRGLRRDGRILLVLQAIFLVDATFLNAEIATMQLTLGAFINALLFALAMVKLRVVLKILRPRITRGELASMVVQLAVLFALPCVLRRIDHGSISPIDFYAVWWILGLLPVVHALLTHALPEDLDGRSPATSAVPVKAYLSLPWLSLLVHVSILHYVYNVPFFGADAAPVLLGLAVAMKRAIPTRFVTLGQLRTLRVMLPIAAVWVSANSSWALGFSALGISITTAKLALVGAYLTCVYLFLMTWARYFLTGGALAGMAFAFGPSMSELVDVADIILTWVLNILESLVPKNASQWGIVGVVFGFIFLVIGAAVSLMRPPPVIEVKSGIPVQDT